MGMELERRWGTRKVVDVDAVIDNQSACLLRGHIGNISIGGLFLKTDPTALRMHAPIELVLLLESRGGMRVYRLPAIVVRLTPDGAGLMFDQYDDNAFRTLVVLLLEQKNSAHAVKHREQAVTTGSTEDDDEYVDLIVEGVEASAMDAAAFAPVLQQLSPLFGELQTKKVPL